MPKMKTHKGLTKRVKVTASGKVTYKRATGNHLMSSKSGNQIRKLRRTGVVPSVFGKKMREALGA